MPSIRHAHPIYQAIGPEEQISAPAASAGAVFLCATRFVRRYDIQKLSATHTTLQPFAPVDEWEEKETHHQLPSGHIWIVCMPHPRLLVLNAHPSPSHRALSCISLVIVNVVGRRWSRGEMLALSPSLVH